MSALEPQQKLAYAILEFLTDSIKDGTVRSDDQESMEVAMQCISESFSVDWSSDSPNSALSVKPSSLLSIFEVFLKTQKKSCQLLGRIYISAYPKHLTNQ